VARNTSGRGSAVRGKIFGLCMPVPATMRKNPWFSAPFAQVLAG
jgi:hypothetical protein